MFTIQKDLNGIFWHIYNNLKTKVSVSDFDVVIDDVSNTFIIQCKNGSNIPNQAISISLIQVIDLSIGTSPIPFSGANGLIQLLTAKGYTPYLQVPPSVSVVVYRVGQVGVFTMTPTQFTDNFTETGLGTNTMLGWALRNGNNGTKNQQGKFSLNKGSSPYDVIGTLGGSANSVLIGHDHESAVFSNGRKGVNDTGTGGTFNGNVLVEAAANQKIVKTSIKGQSNTGADVPSEDGVGKNMPPYLIDVWVERVTELVINSGSGGGGGGVQSVTGTTVDNTDPENPVVDVPTLQQITDEGATTDNTMTVADGNGNETQIQIAQIQIQDEFGSTSQIGAQGAGFTNVTGLNQCNVSIAASLADELVGLNMTTQDGTNNCNINFKLDEEYFTNLPPENIISTFRIPFKPSGDYTLVTSGELGAAAFSNDYNDLSNKPTIPAAQVNSDWNSVSGVSQILNKPTIPAAQVNSDWNAVSGVAQILNKPTIPSIAGLVRNIVKDAAVSSTLTGTTTETILKSYEITGGTFSATDIINLASARFTKTGGSTNAINLRMYVNTSNSLSGATLIAGLTNAQGFYYKFGRTFTLRGGNIIGLSNTSNGIQVGLDYGNLSIVPSSATLNPANTFWIIFSGQLTVTTDTLIASEILITN